MQKAVISWIGVRKFITTDKRKLFYEPSSAKMNSRNFLFFIKEPVFLKLVQKRINVGPNSFIFTMKVCATSHNTLQNTVFRISDSHPVYAVYQGDKVHPATICLISLIYLISKKEIFFVTGNKGDSPKWKHKDAQGGYQHIPTGLWIKLERLLI